MSPEQQVPLKKTCQKLEDAGIEIESYWRWINQCHEKGSTWQAQHTSWGYPAPTVAELLEEIPDRIEIGELTFELVLQKGSDNMFFPGYYHFKTDQTLSDHSDKNLAEALAQVLLWLKENKHI